MSVNPHHDHILTGDDGSTHSPTNHRSLTCVFQMNTPSEVSRGRSPVDGGLGSEVLCGCAGRLLLGVTKTGTGLLNPVQCPNRGWNPITYPISEEVPQTPIRV